MTGERSASQVFGGSIEQRTQVARSAALGHEAATRRERPVHAREYGVVVRHRSATRRR